MITNTPLSASCLGRSQRALKSALILVVSVTASVLEPAVASNITWNGGGGDNNWGTGLNWDTNSAPVAGDALFFDGSVRLTPSNNITADTSFGGITFNSGASAFTLSGNRITLGGNITNNSGVLQTIGLNMILGSSRTVDTASGDLAISGVLSGTGGVTKIGSGTLTLSGANTYTGTTTVSAGSLALSGGSAIANTGAVNLSTSGANLTLNAAEAIGRLDGVAGTTVTLGSNILSIQNTAGGTFSGNLLGGTGGVTLNTNTVFTLSGVNTFTGIARLNAGSSLILSGGAALADTATVNMVASGANLTLNNSETIGNLSGVAGTTITLGGNTLTVNTQSAAIFGGVIDGSGGLSLTGGFSQTLYGANTYTGATTLRGGFLTLDFSQVGAPATNIISSSSGLMLDGGTVAVKGASGATNSQSFNGLTLSSGATTITLTQNSAISVTASLGAITRTNGATLNFSVVPSASGVIATTTNTNDTSGILGTWASTGTGTSMSYAAVNGSGQIVAYTGATSATAADLSNMTSGTTNYKYSAATTLVGNQIGNTLQYTGAASTTALGTRSLTLNGLMNVGTGALTISGAAGNQGLVIGASGELDILGSAAISITAVISGAGNVVYGGVSTLTLQGVNTYTGTTTINSGILSLNGGNAIADTGQVNIAGTVGTRTLNLAASETIGSLKGVAGSLVTLNNKTLTTGDAGDTTFAGVISGAGGGLTKQGAGTFTLSGSNTYTGATTVTAGTLLVSGSLASNVTVNGGVFGGTGTATGATVNAGAALQGGDGATASGALSLAGNVTLADNSLIKLTLGSAGSHSSLARTGGTWVFDSNQAFSFINAGANVGMYDNLITGLTGTEAGLLTIGTWTISNAGWVGTFSFDGSNIDLNLAAVPEPGTWTLLAFSLTAACIFGRRKRSGV